MKDKINNFKRIPPIHKTRSKQKYHRDISLNNDIFRESMIKVSKILGKKKNEE